MNDFDIKQEIKNTNRILIIMFILILILVLKEVMKMRLL